jgi:hypothetical protein
VKKSNTHGKIAKSKIVKSPKKTKNKGGKKRKPPKGLK